MSFRIVPFVKGAAPIISLYRPVLLIGRHAECDVRIESPKVSRRHCCVATAYDRIIIRDLGSRNGVRVNGRLLQESVLRSGDELAIGPILFRMEEEIEQPAMPIRPGAAPAARTRPATAANAGWEGSAGAEADRPGSDIELVPIDDI
jgi:predicted component of type VI protein secretion system